MNTFLLNISPFNNDWNKSVLDMSWRERDVARGIAMPAKRDAKAVVKPHASAAPTSPNAKHSSEQ